MALIIPGTIDPALATSPTIEQQITESVQRFEQKFATFGLLSVARVQGWIEDYRKELVKIAEAARK